MVSNTNRVLFVKIYILLRNCGYINCVNFICIDLYKNCKINFQLNRE